MSTPHRSPVHTAADLIAWFDHHARDLPWRKPKHRKQDAYPALVAELMLQQTQASRVAERFEPFLERFPTAAHLAAADEADVLAMWSGLGYYRRAKLLHAAAKAAVEHHQGALPKSADSLRTLPGIGRYTAGAIASMVHNHHAPAVDGNVQRVFLRLEGIDLPLRSKQAESSAWAWAEHLVHQTDHPGKLNEALIELGATVCTPANPRCNACPIAHACIAHAQDRTADIPRPKPRKPKQTVHAIVALVTDQHHRVLVERRPPQGMWASMHQAPTAERQDRPWKRAELSAALDLTPVGRKISTITHETTHRTFHFQIYPAQPSPNSPHRLETPHRFWITPDQLNHIAISSIQRRILNLAFSKLPLVQPPTPT